MGMDFSAFYRDCLGLAQEGLIQKLASRSELRMVGKREVFQRIGEVAPRVDILARGLVRGFFLDRTGKEIVDCFEYEPGTPLLSSFALGEPSVISLEALDTTLLVSLPLDYLSTLWGDPEMLGAVNRFLSAALRRHWESKMMLAQYAAKERYLWFLENYPDVIHRVSHKHVATFLGMTSVSLSRIRRELRESLERQKAAGSSAVPAGEAALGEPDK